MGTSPSKSADSCDNSMSINIGSSSDTNGISSGRLEETKPRSSLSNADYIDLSQCSDDDDDESAPTISQIEEIDLVSIDDGAAANLVRQTIYESREFVKKNGFQKNSKSNRGRFDVLSSSLNECTAVTTTSSTSTKAAYKAEAPPSTHNFPSSSACISSPSSLYSLPVRSPLVIGPAAVAAPPTISSTTNPPLKKFKTSHPSAAKQTNVIKPHGNSSALSKKISKLREFQTTDTIMLPVYSQTDGSLQPQMVTTEMHLSSSTAVVSTKVAIADSTSTIEQRKKVMKERSKAVKEKATLDTTNHTSRISNSNIARTINNVVNNQNATTVSSALLPISSSSAVLPSTTTQFQPVDDATIASKVHGAINNKSPSINHDDGNEIISNPHISKTQPSSSSSSVIPKTALNAKITVNANDPLKNTTIIPTLVKKERTVAVSKASIVAATSVSESQSSSCDNQQRPSFSLSKTNSDADPQATVVVTTAEASTLLWTSTKQTFTIPRELRLPFSTSILQSRLLPSNDTHFSPYSRRSNYSSNSNSSSGGRSNGNYNSKVDSQSEEVQAAKIMKDLKELEWKRSRQLIAANFMRAKATWLDQFQSRLDEATNTSNEQSPELNQQVSKHQKVILQQQVQLKKKKHELFAKSIIERVSAQQRLMVVGTFQSHRSAKHKQEISPRPNAVPISQKVTANHISTLSHLSISTVKKESTRCALSIAENVRNILQTGFQHSEQSLHHKRTTSTADDSTTSEIVYNLVIPYSESIPFAWTWIPIPMNVLAEDDPVLRVVPYFGDDDTEGADISQLVRDTGEWERRICGEAEELTLMYLMRSTDSFNDQENSKKAYLNLSLCEKLFRVSKDQLPKAYELIADGAWYREDVKPILLKIDEAEQSNFSLPVTSMNDASLSLLSLYQRNSKKDQDYLEECGNELPLFELRSKEGPVFDVDSANNLALGVGVGLGILNVNDCVDMTSNYRQFFCRRCFCYACPEHLLEQPQPKIRRDPLPPLPCPINYLSLPTDNIRAQLKHPIAINHRNSTVSLTLDEFILARETNSLSALRSSLALKLSQVASSEETDFTKDSSTPDNNSANIKSKHTNHQSNNHKITKMNLARVNASHISQSSSKSNSKRPRSVKSDNEDSDHPSRKYTTRGTAQHVQNANQPTLNTDVDDPLDNQSRFVDSLFVDADGVIQWFEPSYTNDSAKQLNSSNINDTESSIFRRENKIRNTLSEPISFPGVTIETNSWLEHGAVLLDQAIHHQQNLLNQKRLLEEKQKEQEQQRLKDQDTNFEQKTNHGISGQVGVNALLAENASSTICNSSIVIPFNPTDFKSHETLAQKDAVWRSKLHTKVLHLSDEVPTISIIPRSAVTSFDSIDELEMYVREYQKSFSPPLTDAELSIVYKGLHMYRNSPQSIRRYNLGDSSDDEQNKMKDLLLFLQRLLGTRTTVEIQNIITRKSLVVGLRDRADNKRDTIRLDIDDDVDALITTVDEILALLPPPPIDCEAKLTQSTKPPDIKNCFKSNYQPCTHAGICGKNNKDCSCGAADSYCEKYCACGPNCRIKVQGCKCKSGCRTKSCPCLAASRVCDPDLCGTCGASVAPWYRMDVCSFIQNGLHKAPDAIANEDGECDDDGNNNVTNISILDGRQPTQNKFGGNNHVSSILMCSNISFSHRRKARVYVGKSNIHGWGAFAGQRIERGEFIMEYFGELISQEEAERRGIIYDKHKSSYIFEANLYECVDATRKGNRARFLNHVCDAEANVMPKIMKINGDHRIGMFAKTTIEPGQELTFNYGYSNNSAPEWAHNEEDTDPSLSINLKQVQRKDSHRKKDVPQTRRK